MKSNIVRAAQYWNEYTAEFRGRETGLFWWEAGPEIQQNINRKISGSPHTDWIEYTLHKYFDNQLPLTNCLSLGCGTGSLERALARHGTFRHCDAFDVATTSVQVAADAAREEGFENISYHVADVNTLALASSLYDVIWINCAMHHFEALEMICSKMREALKPDGLLIINEYIGPSRFQFPDRQKEITNLCLRLLPVRYRTVVREAVARELNRSPLRKGLGWFVARLVDKVRDGDLIGVVRRRLRAYRAASTGQGLCYTTVSFPSVRDVATLDPSEAVRSGDIIRVLRNYFDIVEKKDWGGNILQFLLAGIAGNFSGEDPQSQAILRMLLNIEDTLIHCGELDSDFAYIVARPLRA